MKSAFISLVALITPILACAGQHQFFLNPFSQVILTNDKGKESVVIEVGDKFGEEIIYQSKLKHEGLGVYKTPDGVIFTVANLPKPQTAGVGTRYTFVAKRKLVISGSGKAFDTLIQRIKPDLKDVRNPVLYEEGYKP